MEKIKKIGREKMERIEMDLDEEDLEIVNELAQEMGVSRGEVVRMLIAFALDHTDDVFEDEEPPEDLENEGPEDEF